MKTERKQQQIRFDVGTSDYIKKNKNTTRSAQLQNLI